MVNGTQCISDMNICYTGNCYDRTNSGLLHFNLIQSIKLIQFADLNLNLFLTFVMIADYDLLIDFYGSVINFAHTDTSHVFIIINGTYQHLGPCLRVTFRCRNVVYNCLKKRLHIHPWFIGIHRSNSGLRGSKYKRTIQLCIVSI